MIPAQARKPKPQGRDEGHTETPRHTTQTPGTLAGLYLDHRVTVMISTGTFGVNLGGQSTHGPGGGSGPPRGHIHPGPKKPPPHPHTLRALWILGRGHRSQRSSLAEDGSPGGERQSKRPLEQAPLPAQAQPEGKMLYPRWVPGHKEPQMASVSWLHPKGHTLPGALAQAVGWLSDRPHPYPGPSAAPRGDHEGGAWNTQPAHPCPPQFLPRLFPAPKRTCYFTKPEAHFLSALQPDNSRGCWEQALTRLGDILAPRTSGTASASGPGGMVKGSWLQPQARAQGVSSIPGALAWPVPSSGCRQISGD